MHADVDDVARGLLTGGVGTESYAYASLEDAFARVPSRFDLSVQWAWYLTGSTDRRWTMILSSRCPYPELGEFMAARANINVKCDYVSIGWLPQSPKSVAEIDSAPAFAYFLDFRRPSRLSRDKNTGSNTRFIQVSEQESGWEFEMSGPERAYESAEQYSLRRKTDRLPAISIGTYLSSAGVPVDDDWLLRPTAVLLDPSGGAGPDGYTDVAQLRKRFGYPMVGVPETLRR